MGERLQLSLERIKAIPDEVDQNSSYGIFFASLSKFFGGNKREMPSLLQECMESCDNYLFPKEALEKDELGDILSALLYISLGIVYEQEERAICRVLELFIELYLQFKNSSAPDRKCLKDILYAHFYDYTGEFLEEWKDYIQGVSYKESDIPGRHNLLFPLFFLGSPASSYFSEEYEDAHRNDIALILGNRLLSHIEREWRRLDSKKHCLFGNHSPVSEGFSESEKERETGEVTWKSSPHALSFHEHQKKILKIFLKEL